MDIMKMIEGCLTNGLDIPDKVKDALAGKYGQNFVLTSIGNRYNTGSATLFCHPEGNERIAFKAVYDCQTENVTDDYAVRKIAAELEDSLSEKFRAQGIGCGSFASFTGGQTQKRADTDETASEFLKRSDLRSVSVYMAVNRDDVSSVSGAEKWLSVIQKLYDDTGKKIMVTAFFVSVSDFEKCVSEMRKCPSVNRFWFEKFSTSGKVLVTVNEEGVSSGAEEIVRAAGGAENG